MISSVYQTGKSLQHADISVLQPLFLRRYVTNQHGMTLWLTGLSGAGKSTIAREVAKSLSALGIRTQVLDADVVRPHLCPDLGYSRQDREENVRRIAYVADLLTQQGVIVLVAAIAPYASSRAQVRELIEHFVEVFVDAPISVCEQRDPKGLYKRVRAGKIENFTGIDDPYEQPLSPDLWLETHQFSVEQCVAQIVGVVCRRFNLA